MIIVNGEIEKEDFIKFDEGFSFGLGAFETILVKDRPIFLQEHIDRLNNSLEVLDIGKKFTVEEAAHNIKKFNIENLALKIMVSSKNTIYTTRKIQYTRENYQRGFNLKLSNIKRNPHSHVTFIKSFNYTDNIIEKNLATKEGFDEVLFLNGEGRITEGAVSNLFFIKDKVIYTPSIKNGLLPGIIRKWVINKFDVVEGQYSLHELLNSDGAFLTNSLIGIMKINSIQGKTIKYCDIIEYIGNEYEREINL